MQIDNIVNQGKLKLDGVDRDIFGRTRVSNPITLFDDKHLYSKNDGTNGEQVYVYGHVGGGTSTYRTNESSVRLGCTTASGDSAVKQSRLYTPYIPGKSQLLFMTGVLNNGELNCKKEFGIGDDLNGLFFSQIDGVNSVTLRTDTSGTVVDTVYEQSTWNIDTFDGSGSSSNPTGIGVDFTKAQIFSITFQWLGVGGIVFAMDIDNKLLPCHTVHNANNKPIVYMRTSTLPVRYKIENTGVTTSANYIDTICASIVSEGGYLQSGITFNASNGATLRNITTRTPILAVRMSTTYNGRVNRVVAEILKMVMYSETNGALFELCQVSGVIISVTGTFAALEADVSACDVSTDLTAISGEHEHVINYDYVPAASGGKAFQSSGQSQAPNTRDVNHFISQNFNSTQSTYFVVFATSLNVGASADVSCAITWQEIQ